MQEGVSGPVGTRILSMQSTLHIPTQVPGALEPLSGVAQMGAGVWYCDSSGFSVHAIEGGSDH
jgi:hypothetical protein